MGWTEALTDAQDFQPSHETVYVTSNPGYFSDSSLDIFPTPSYPTLEVGATYDIHDYLSPPDLCNSAAMPADSYSS
jgi:hypothetical protein